MDISQRIDRDIAAEAIANLTRRSATKAKNDEKIAELKAKIADKDAKKKKREADKAEREANKAEREANKAAGIKTPRKARKPRRPSTRSEAELEALIEGYGERGYTKRSGKAARGYLKDQVARLDEQLKNLRKKLKAGKGAAELAKAYAAEEIRVAGGPMSRQLLELQETLAKVPTKTSDVYKNASAAQQSEWASDRTSFNELIKEAKKEAKKEATAARKASMAATGDAKSAALQAQKDELKRLREALNAGKKERAKKS